MDIRGPIAQLAEHRADNAGVSGAIPLRPTNFCPRWWAEIDAEAGRDQQDRLRHQDSFRSLNSEPLDREIDLLGL